MPDNSFDIVSKIDLQEVSNAIQQALKEIHTRFDLKDSKSNIELEKRRHRAALDRRIQAESGERHAPAETGEARGVAEGLTYGAVEPAAGGTAKQRITMQQGIPIEKAREIVKPIKDSKKKAQASIQGDLVRVSGKDRDTLQEIIALLKQHDFGIDLQFTNYRTN